MIRFDYRQSPFERFIGRRPSLSVDRRMRSPLIAIGIAVVLVATTFLIESARLNALSATIAGLQDELDAAQRADARVADLQRSVAHLRTIADAIAASQRATFVQANTIARIGNLLPSETWLTRLQTTPTGSWSIAGRSTRVDRVGETLASLAAIDRRASARLISITVKQPRSAVLDFIIGWDPSR